MLSRYHQRMKHSICLQYISIWLRKAVLLQGLTLLIAVFFTGNTLSGQGLESGSITVKMPQSVFLASTEDMKKEVTQDQRVEKPWYERIRFDGDFRSRHEGFYQTGRETRNRARFRLRLRVNTDINDDTQFHLQVASGDPGTPVSTNQSFTSFFRPKPFNLDRAFLAYNPQATSAITLGIGKFGFPQKRTQMIFDNDLNFEGSWEKVSWDLSDRVGISLVALQTAVNEVSKDADAYMVAGYGEVNFKGERAEFSVSAANYRWGNPDSIVGGQSDRVLRSILTNAVKQDSFGSVIGYASGFNVIDIIAETTIRTRRISYPLRLLADFSRNTRATNDRDSGFWLEVEYGSPRLVNTWGATYTYGWLEQDVSPSAFVFSDIPGTNIRLHMIETSYVPKEGLNFDVTLHLTKKLVVPEEDPNNFLTRLHVAIVARF